MHESCMLETFEQRTSQMETTSHGDNQPREQQFEIDVADPSSTTSKGAEQDQASS